MTSATNCGWMQASLILSCNSCLTVPWDLGLIFWGLQLTFSTGHSPDNSKKKKSYLSFRLSGHFLMDKVMSKDNFTLKVKTCLVKQAKEFRNLSLGHTSSIRGEFTSQHSYKCCLPSSIFSQHDNNLRICKLSSLNCQTEGT